MSPADGSPPKASSRRAKDQPPAWICTHPDRSPAIFSEMIDPMGIVRIPASLPVGLRQLVELLLLLCYPFWLVLVVFLWLGGRALYLALLVLFSPITLYSRLKDPVKFAANRKEQKAKKLDVFLQTVVPNPERQSAPEE